MTSFRATFVILLILSCLVYFYQTTLARQGNGFSSEERQGLSESLHEHAGYLAEQLGIQELAGLALADRYENMAQGESLHLLLESALEEAPAVVRSIGVTESGDEGRITSFVSRDPSARLGGLIMTSHNLPQGLPASAREINMERRIHWQLLATPLAGMAPRLSTIMTITGVDRREETFMVGDLDWLRNLLEAAHAAMPGYLFCVTPAGDTIWVQDGTLSFDHNRLEDAGDRRPFHNVTRFLHVPDAAGGRDLVKAEAVDTGWYLIAVRGNPVSGYGRWGVLSLLAVLFTALTLLVEYLLSSFAKKSIVTAGNPANTSQAAVMAGELPQKNGGPIALSGFSPTIG